jgi:hypothetical protein
MTDFGGIENVSKVSWDGADISVRSGAEVRCLGFGSL